jgi:ribosomal protein L40E
MIDADTIRARYEQMAPFLDERGRRLFVAGEALSLGHGGVTAVAAATGMARSTINRGLAELKAGHADLGGAIRRPGGGRKRAVETQPGLLTALEALIEDATAATRNRRCAGSAAASATSPRRCGVKGLRSARNWSAGCCAT